ncbi:hypothetical protein CHLNCDRAFT_57128 [Chlorella variabilis]|uniref:Tr-type G domain-containing protein n=1 Tax=Chlorella variabilis TaxID=554065 RepID=E1Z8B7_CHLVA|nr:hypothetical protein CHLNCDRAFT_57128 [Chlorella variabilis]EFN58066.1 hypothetical protein CHLNCDRAFT_57128 [Chlorella variabilis]|eukprot:XP_005850168.1 hypothetical protein CHLNCDRAFT_57128 [Chlorella variabilis]
MASHKPPHHRQGYHPLSSKLSADHEGWTEGIASLTEHNTATQLLDERPATNGRKVRGRRGQHVSGTQAGTRVRCRNGGGRAGAPDGYGPTSLTEPQLDELLAAVEAHMGERGADVTVVRRRKVAAPSVGAPDMSVADVCIRRRVGSAPPLEVRVAVVGNVDSGKSTMVGVLTRSVLDDGRGFARSKVFRHGHEVDTGRTSSIGQHNLCLDSRGGILNDAAFRTQSIADYVARASKVVTLVDLAGHEKVPVFFVVTKIDLAPEHVLKHTLATLQQILKKPGVKKRPFLVRSRDDVLTCARHMHADSLAPIFLTSSVTGRGLDLIRLFYNLLPQRHNWFERTSEHAEFIIDETFGVPGVGTVVAGTVKRGVIAPNSTLLLGPDIADGTFKPVTVKSVHYKRLPVGRIVRQAARVVAMDRERLRSGDRACVRFRFLQRPEYLTPGTRFVFREGRTKGIGMVVGTEMSPTAIAAH